MIVNQSSTSEEAPSLRPGMDLPSAIAFNAVDVVGVGPFITLPLMVAALHGPLAIVGWIAGATVAMADGLIWAELGAAMPRAGGSYEYLQRLYGPKLGRLLSFLFVFQLIFSAPASIATGCIGLASYASYLFPASSVVFFRYSRVEVSGIALIALLTAIFATFCVYRGIAGVARLSRYLWAGVLAALLFVILGGATHFHASLAFPPDWTHNLSGFWTGFGSALLIALYDFWGYYNICFVAEEVIRPAYTIPRAIIISILIVSVLYVAMNISVLGALPTKQIIADAAGGGKIFVAAQMLEAVYGSWAGKLVSVLVIWTAFASVFSLLAGYSRIPFAAARDGNFFRPLAKLHPKLHFPARSVLLLGALAALLCFVQLRDLISALVVIRVMLLFLLQAIGVVLWRRRDPAAPRPFRMWLYPLPVLISVAGFLYVLYDKRGLFWRGLVFAAFGIAIYLIRQSRRPSARPAL